MAGSLLIEHGSLVTTVSRRSPDAVSPTRDYIDQHQAQIIVLHSPWSVLAHLILTFSDGIRAASRYVSLIIPEKLRCFVISYPTFGLISNFVIESEECYEFGKYDALLPNHLYCSRWRLLLDWS